MGETLYSGLDLTEEIRTTETQRVGDTVLLEGAGGLAAPLSRGLSVKLVAERLQHFRLQILGKHDRLMSASGGFAVIPIDR